MSNEQQTRSFHLGDVLSITTGFLLSPRGIEGVYDILNFMTGDSLYTHQLPRASRECSPFILAQHPQLVAVRAQEITTENYKIRLTEFCRQFGEQLDIRPLAPGQHQVINPIAEAASMLSPSTAAPSQEKP